NSRQAPISPPPPLTACWTLGRSRSASPPITGCGRAATPTCSRTTLTCTGRLATSPPPNTGASSSTARVKPPSGIVISCCGGMRHSTAAERGRLFCSREGKAGGWNRHRLLRGHAPLEATFNDSMTGLEYSYAGLDYLKNEVVVICHPRTISSSTNDLLWQLEYAVITVDQGKSRTLYVKYEDEGSDRRVDARDVTVTNVTF